MIRPFRGEELGSHIQSAFPGAVETWQEDTLWIRPERILEVCRLLKETPRLAFNLLNAISAVDYVEYFEVVYHLTSTARSHSAILKTKLHGRDGLVLPSVVGVWQGADLQEREIWDLMGIQFSGHHNLKRVMLWDGFPGHPLRKDFLEEPR